LFTYELQRKLSAAGSTTAALAAHPGGSRTNLGNENPGGFFNTLIVATLGAIALLYAWRALNDRR